MKKLKSSFVAHLCGWGQLQRFRGSMVQWNPAKPWDAAATRCRFSRRWPQTCATETVFVDVCFFKVFDNDKEVFFWVFVANLSMLAGHWLMMINLCSDIWHEWCILMLIFERYCLNDPQPQEISICCTSSVLCTSCNTWMLSCIKKSG